jgi:F-type H+-transporting ATPase subunit b
MEILRDAEFWVAVAFVILIASVWKPLKRALADGLDGRAAKIKAELEEARHLADEAAALLAEYRTKEGKALGEAEEILRHAAAEAERSRQAGASELKASLERRERQALERIAQAEAKAIAEVRALSVELALAATRRLIQDNLDAKRASGLIDQAIAELPQRLH